ncbi:zinc metalloprotease [Actinomadura rugatobispora]|uniref:Zinc metalloprotease n=1 Tax=Actinomadura rugatobispora TaxID=1994 RepID=A0ABW1A2N1_9ACTN|nr:zinc metalloprotease [Actinomadura rugatobispora]
MKPFAAAVTLIAALVPAVPAGTATVQGPPAGPGPVQAPGPGKAPGSGHEPGVRRLASARDCPPAGARLRSRDTDPHGTHDDGHGHGHDHGHGGDRAHEKVREGGRNDLTPAEAHSVERELQSILAGLGLGKPGAPQPGAAQPGAAQPDPQAARRKAPRVTVPVYFHVLHDGPTGNLSNDDIRRQIQSLNDAHGGKGAGADTGFAFALHGVTRTDNATWYGDPERHEQTFKTKLRKGGAGTLNLYSADMGEAMLGWSTFPWSYRANPKMDGVIIHPESMPHGSIENFNLGHTATHEIGHWLGLYHTFQDGCAGDGDRVADTPAERDPTNGCPADKDTCPAVGADPVHNYMDYAFDDCMNQFTKGQGDRMHLVWTAYRR